mmetsp:Transcript_12751/g.24825  ORF Transcript_12751/g.24825 Transcript_12751/m.24825 type:complete len:174 (-) Transcript_12751:1522-2043(-)
MPYGTPTSSIECFELIAFSIEFSPTTYIPFSLSSFFLYFCKREKKANKTTDVDTHWSALDFSTASVESQSTDRPFQKHCKLPPVLKQNLFPGCLTPSLRPCMCKHKPLLRFQCSLLQTYTHEIIYLPERTWWIDRRQEREEKSDAAAWLDGLVQSISTRPLREEHHMPPPILH